MKRPIYILLAMALLVCILLAACGGGGTTAPATQPATGTTPGTTAATKPAAETPVSGGTLRSIHGLMLSNLGYIPERSEPLDSWIAQTALETLLRVMPDGSLGPFLADKYEVAPDMMSATFYLKKGVKFHDGTDFNAAAVKSNLELYMSGILPELKHVSKIDIIDDYSVKVNFSQKKVGFLLPFAQRPAQMQSPNAYKTNAKEWFLTHLVGTGPFKWDSYQRDISLKFVKFPDYYKKPKPYLDGITFSFIADMTTATMSFRAGEGETLTYPSGKDFEALKAGGAKLLSTGGPIFTILMDGNNPTSPFGDINVRKAVAYCVDKGGITKGLGYGMWEPVNQWAWKDHWSYDKTIVGYDYNLAKAKEMMSKSSYPNGFKTRILGSGDVAELVQKYLKEIGIEAVLEPGTMAQFSEMRQKGWTNGISIAPFAGPPQYKDSPIGVGIFSSKSGSYPTCFHNQEIDNLIEQAGLELDFAKRDAINKKLNQIMVDTYCANIPLYHHVAVIAHQPNVRDWNYIVDGAGTWAPEDAWLKK